MGIAMTHVSPDKKRTEMGLDPEPYFEVCVEDMCGEGVKHTE
jgi:hypothetical protein